MMKKLFLIVALLAATVLAQQVDYTQARRDASANGVFRRQRLDIVDSLKSSGVKSSEASRGSISDEKEEDSDVLDSTSTNTTNSTLTNTTANATAKVPPHELSIAEIVRNIDLNANYTKALDGLAKLNNGHKAKAEEVNPLLHQLNLVIDDASGQLGRFDYKNTTKVNISELNNLIRYTDQKTQREVGPAVKSADKQATSGYIKQQLHKLNATAAELGDELRTSLPSIVYQQIMKLG